MIGSNDRESVEHWGSVQFSHSVVCFDGHYEVRGNDHLQGPPQCVSNLPWRSRAAVLSARARKPRFLPISRLDSLRSYVSSTTPGKTCLVRNT
jgi:hypothetical protein